MALGAAGLVLAVQPAAALTRVATGSAAAAYIRARAAESRGAADLASAGYAAALTDAPRDEAIAQRAFRVAMVTGDLALARRAVSTLDTIGKLPPDGTLLLLADAVAARDWPRARQLVDRIGREDIFSFLAPVCRAWIARDAGDADPLAQLDRVQGQPLGAPYVAEHRALLLLATGKVDEGVAAIQALGAPATSRSIRLRLVAAARLTDLKRDDRALALLAGDDPALIEGRARIATHRPLPAPIDTAAAGIAELLLRVGGDINRERVTPLALTLGRLSTVLAPRNSEAWIVTSGLLASGGQYRPAVAALANVAPDDPFASAARDLRVQFLLRSDDKPAALAEALAGTARRDADAADWVRVGDLHADLDRPADAAAAYDRAIGLAKTDAGAEPALWTLWLRRGSALDQAGDWPAAKAALAKALALAPDQPVVLNYLGYAQLERRENLAAAEKLIEQASALRPDDAAITDSLGWAYYVRGDIPKAIATLERAVASEPGESTMNEHLGDAYWVAGRRYEARYAWAAALVYAEEKDVARIRGKIETGAPRGKP